MAKRLLGPTLLSGQDLVPRPPSLGRFFYLVVTEEGTGIVGSKVKGQLWGMEGREGVGEERREG